MQNTFKWQQAKWYDREYWPYEVDRTFVKDCAWWVKQVAWQLICTFTFAWHVSDLQAEKTYAAFINRLECLLRADVAFVCGSEKQSESRAKPASGRHFHVLLASTAPLHPTFVKELWQSMGGNRSDDAGAKVEGYDSSGNGAEYVLKYAPEKNGEWSFRKLELFHPEARGLHAMTKRFKRRLRRHKERQKKFSSPAAPHIVSLTNGLSKIPPTSVEVIMANAKGWWSIE
jgi:hypothetical protein